MNLTRCEVGHFFDRDKFDSCPHCAGSGIQQKSGNEPDDIVRSEVFWTPPMLNISHVKVDESDIQQLTASKVDIYRNAAVITYQAEIWIQKGENILYFENDHLGDRSRVSITPVIKDIQILGSLQVYIPDEEGKARIREEEEKKQNTEARVREIDEKINVLYMQLAGYRKLLKWNKNATIQEAADWIENQFPEKTEKALHRINELEREKEKLENNTITTQVLASERQNRVFGIRIMSDSDKQIHIQISDETRQVYWIPKYEIHMKNEAQPLLFKLRASVRRNGSWEEWKDIPVCLYGERTGEQNVVPVLDPMYLQYQRQYAMPYLDVPNLGVPYTAGEDDGNITMPMNAAEGPVTAQLLDGDYFDKDMEPEAISDMMPNPQGIEAPQPTGFGSAMVFNVSEKWSFPAIDYFDRRFEDMLFDITEYIVPATYSRYAVPSKSAKVYLCADVQGKDLPDLLESCNADLYVGSVRIGSTPLYQEGAFEGYRICMGKEDGVFVTKKRTAYLHEGTKKSKFEKEHFTYSILISNNTDSELKLTIKDLLPISQDQRIAVVDVNVMDAELDEKNGELTWNRVVAAKGTEEIVFWYTVLKSEKAV